MNRIKVQKNTNYTTINNTIIKDKRISLKAKGLFLTVMSLPDDWDFSVSGIITILKEDELAVRNALRELNSFGYCEFEIIRENGKFAGTDYTFHELPQTFETQTDKPRVDNPHTVNPRVDNQAQLSKERNQIRKRVRHAPENETEEGARRNRESSTRALNTPHQIFGGDAVGDPPQVEILHEFYPSAFVSGGDFRELEQIKDLDVWREVCRFWQSKSYGVRKLENIIDRYHNQLREKQFKATQPKTFYYTPEMLDQRERDYLESLQARA